MTGIIPFIGLLIAMQGMTFIDLVPPPTETTISISDKNEVVPYPDLTRERIIYFYRTFPNINSAATRTETQQLGATTSSLEEEKIGKVWAISQGGMDQNAFGSVTVAFNKIGTRKEWLRVRKHIEARTKPDCHENARCWTNSKDFKAIGFPKPQENILATLKAVNAYVNQIIRYQPDSETYKQLDYWASPDEVTKNRTGDCEDFAILKMALLRSLGIEEKDQSLIILKDTRRSSYHAVLAVKTAFGIFILDNMQPEILYDHQLPNYLPLYSFSGKNSFIHGWRKRNLRVASGRVNADKIAPGMGPKAFGYN